MYFVIFAFGVSGLILLWAVFFKTFEPLDDEYDVSEHLI